MQNPHSQNDLVKRFQRKRYTLEEYVAGIAAQNPVLLSQAITLIESTLPAHQYTAQAILEQCLPRSGNSIRIGITGTPGVGKSTFIEALGNYVLSKGHRLAVLAIDPSSQVSKGSILGDKTRMQTLSADKNAFIRPTPAGDSLGGVARKTRETIVLCEAAGYDVILVETVGVGQSETIVHSMVDFFLLLLLPNSGDELQGIKRGVMEMADLVVINKADGDVLPLAKLAQKQCNNALHLFPPKASDWTAHAVLCSALEKSGIDAIWQQIQSYETQTKGNQFFNTNRSVQAQFWLHQSIEQQLKDLFYQNPRVLARLQQLEPLIQQHQISPFQASEELLKIFTNQF